MLFANFIEEHGDKHQTKPPSSLQELQLANRAIASWTKKLRTPAAAPAAATTPDPAIDNLVRPVNLYGHPKKRKQPKSDQPNREVTFTTRHAPISASLSQSPYMQSTLQPTLQSTSQSSAKSTIQPAPMTGKDDLSLPITKDGWLNPIYLLPPEPAPPPWTQKGNHQTENFFPASIDSNNNRRNLSQKKSFAGKESDYEDAGGLLKSRHFPPAKSSGSNEESDYEDADAFLDSCRASCKARKLLEDCSENGDFESQKAVRQKPRELLDDSLKEVFDFQPDWEPEPVLESCSPKSPDVHSVYSLSSSSNASAVRYAPASSRVPEILSLLDSDSEYSPLRRSPRLHTQRLKNTGKGNAQPEKFKLEQPKKLKFESPEKKLTGKQQPKQVFRSNSAIKSTRAEAMKTCDFEKGLPLGPFPSFDLLLSSLRVWAQDETHGGGKFNVNVDSRKGPATTRGDRCLLVCECAGKVRVRSSIDPAERKRLTFTKKTNCPWALWVEEIAEGWIVHHMSAKAIAEYDGNGFHNHKLTRGLAESNANARNRSIPSDLTKNAELLIKSGLTVAKTFAALVKSCRDEGREVTFNKKDLSNAFVECSNDKILDSTNLFQHLREREKLDATLKFQVHCDEDGTLDRVFFVLQGGTALWSALTTKIILLDTKHGTNRFGLKLGCFVALDSNGVTRVLAACFLLHQDGDSFKWTFSEFTKAFGCHPNVVFTDGDIAMAEAMVSWPGTTHLYCTFHIWKNFFTNIHPLFVNKSAEWRVVAKKWWALCKDSDVACVDEFPEKWKELTQYILTHANNVEKVREKHGWLQNLGKRAPQWAACYCWNLRTYGIHSTQRSEATFSSVATFCRKTSTILGIVRDLEQMASTQAIGSEQKTIRVMLNTRISASNGFVCPLANSVCTIVTDFARSLVIAQASQLVRYYVRRVGGTEECPQAEPQEEADVIFLVSFAKVNSSATGSSLDDPLVKETASSIPESVREADYGCSDASTELRQHRTTMRECSCQFPKCWGIPCRHMFSVAQHLSWAKVHHCYSHFMLTIL